MTNMCACGLLPSSARDVAIVELGKQRVQMDLDYHRELQSEQSRFLHWEAEIKERSPALVNRFASDQQQSRVEISELYYELKESDHRLCNEINLYRDHSFQEQRILNNSCSSLTGVRMKFKNYSVRSKNFLKPWLSANLNVWMESRLLRRLQLTLMLQQNV